MGIDVLEPRRLLTALPISGSAGNDSWFVQKSGGNWQIWNSIPADPNNPGSSPDRTESATTYSELHFSGGSGDDLIMSRAGGVRFYGGDGADQVRAFATPNPDYYLYYYDSGVGLPRINGVYTDAEWIEITPSGTSGDVIEAYGEFGNQTVVINGDVGPSCDITIDGDLPIRFDTSQHYGGILTLPLGSAKAGANSVIRTVLPSSMSGRKFDLNDNAMVLDYSATSPSRSASPYHV